MSNNRTTLDPSDPEDRVEIVRIELKRRGLSFADLAREFEVNPSTVALVLRGHKSARLEPMIAAAINWQPQQLFPKNYDTKGNRTARTRNKRESKQYTIRAGVKSTAKTELEAA